MLRCMFCPRLLLSLDYLMAHVKLSHKSLMHCEIKCNFEKCSQVYNIYSLKRHILSDHMNNSSNLQHIGTAKMELRKQKNVLQSTTDTVRDYLYKERSSIIDIMSTTCNEINNMDMVQLKDKINESATIVVAKLYACGTLNRTVAHEIIQTISLFYNSICLPVIKNKYNNIDGLHDILQVIENAFDNFKTEYSTFRHLQNIGCLIMPSTIVIDTSVTFGSLGKKRKSLMCHRKISIVPIKMVIYKERL